jgi:hypothetical protein
MENINYEELDRKARPGAFSTLDMEVLVPEVMKLEPGEVYVEIGVDKGKSLSVARMVAKDGVMLFGVDLKDNPCVDGTFFFQGDSNKIAKNWKHGEISVLFIDGDHTYKGCKADIDGWYPHMKKGGVMLFHDCDESSPGVMWAVSEFVCTVAQGQFSLFKYNNKNTSMARIRLL